MMHRDTGEPYSDTEHPRVDALEVDAGTLAFSTLTDIHYSDAHLLHTARAAERPAEQWARAIIENVPAETQARLETAWQGIGLRRSPFGTANTVAGWPIAHTDPEYVLLHTDSPLGFEGQLLFHRTETAVLLATLVQFHTPDAQSVWNRVTPRHLRFVRALLEAQLG